MKQKKRLAACILGTAPSKIRIAPDALGDVEKAITRSDMRGLIAVHKITIAGVNEQSRGRARKRAAQKRKGRRKGRGSKEGSQYAIVTRKGEWIKRIRVQRKFIQALRDKHLLSREWYRTLYGMCKGGYFRNVRHIKLYLNEHEVITRGKTSGKMGEQS